ncbi:MAG: hypothetical protein WC297_02270 [Candidatus Paceibacterota bacterium]|jgi:hypothetical protein
MATIDTYSDDGTILPEEDEPQKQWPPEIEESLEDNPKENPKEEGLDSELERGW